jgi:predicted RNA-binding protein with RPS1 domain
VTGTVTNVTDFGLFLELEEGIEGLVHISEIAKDKQGKPLSRFQVDDVIQAKVINVSRDDKKIGLSIRKLEESTDKDTYRDYLNNNKEATSNLGELLREEMMNLQQVAMSQESESEGIEASESATDSPGEISENLAEEPPVEGADSDDLEPEEAKASEPATDSPGEISEGLPEEPPVEGADSDDLEPEEAKAAEPATDSPGEISEGLPEEPPVEGTDSDDLEPEEAKASESVTDTQDEIAENASEEPLSKQTHSA